MSHKLSYEQILEVAENTDAAGIEYAGEVLREYASLLREREQNGGEAVAWRCERRQISSQWRGVQVVDTVYARTRAGMLILKDKGYTCTPILDDDDASPAQAVSVPSDEAIRAFLHELEGLLIASEDELLPLIREAVVALASASAAPAGDGGDHA